jgi:hypothetical protein
MRHGLICSSFSLESPPRKRKRAKSKYAEVAPYSADFSIAYLGLVVSLREIMAEAALLFSKIDVASYM